MQIVRPSCVRTGIAGCSVREKPLIGTQWIEFQCGPELQPRPLGCWASAVLAVCERGMLMRSRWIAKASIAAVIDVCTARGWQGTRSCKLSKSLLLWH